MNTLSFRLAKKEDLLTYYNWVLDKDVRNNSVQNKIITIHEHRKWFIDSINDPKKKMLIFFINTTPIGQLRLENIEDYWLIDYSIESKYRARKYGQNILKSCLKEFKNNKFKAVVKAENKPSIHIFKKLGFKETETIKVKNLLFKVFLIKN